MKAALAIVLPTLTACAAAPQRPPAPSGDPSAGVVALPAADGWRAQLVLDVAPTGVWCVKAFDVFPQYAEQELVALDDLGRCWVLVSYGGRWTPFQTGPEGSWLGAVVQGDLDARIPGPELYVGAESGRVWQVVAHEREGVIDRRLVAQLDGRAVHALAAGELDLERPGHELLVFTEPAELWVLHPRSDGLDGFEARFVAALDGRIRDASAFARPGEPDGVLMASRAGWVGKLHALSPRLEIERWHELPFGRGRAALARAGGDTFAYSTAEDGTIWRHFAVPGDEALRSEPIYAGPPGPRGIATGRLHADPERESVAVFGYSGRVELLTRPAAGQGPWEVETLFTDRDRGHWLSTAELDGRNATDELVLCGYSGRVVLLARPPGYGVGGVALEPSLESRSRND